MHIYSCWATQPRNFKCYTSNYIEDNMDKGGTPLLTVVDTYLRQPCCILLVSTKNKLKAL